MEQSLKRLFFSKGRSIIFKEKGQILLLRLAQDLEEIGKVEQMPELEGKKMIMFITPKKKITSYAKNENKVKCKKALQVDR